MMRVCIVWRDLSKEPLKFEVESCLSEHGFLCIELQADQLLPEVEHKMLMFPSDTIDSVQIEELKEGYESAEKGYREDSTFREQPGKSKWFQGMGATRNDGEE